MVQPTPAISCALTVGSALSMMHLLAVPSDFPRGERDGKQASLDRNLCHVSL